MTNINEIIKYTSKLNLLYIDDDETARESAVFLFEDIFKSIVIAEDGLDGLDKFQNNEIDLIISDIDMPNMNGLDMIEKIRQIDTNIPITILSAHIKTDFFIRSIKLNIIGYLLKPIDMKPLLDILKNIISSISLKKEIDINMKLKEKLETSNTYLKTILNNIHDPIMVIKEDYSVKIMNNIGKEDLDNLDTMDMSNAKCYEISHNRTTPCDGVNHPCPLKEVLQTKEATTVIHDHYDKDNNKFYVEIAATPLFDSEENCIGIIESSRDISVHVNTQNELRAQKDLLHHQAHHDTLTGLANRALFDDRLEMAILRASRHNTKVALLFIDLNKFKFINDSLGHKIGDAVLKTVSIAMKEKMRQEETIARIGGDEFAIIMENITNLEDIEILYKKITDVVNTPMVFEGHDINISASIGVGIYPDNAKSSDDLFRYSDTAMYKIKNSKDER